MLPHSLLSASSLKPSPLASGSQSGSQQPNGSSATHADLHDQILTVQTEDMEYDELESGSSEISDDDGQNTMTNGNRPPCNLNDLMIKLRYQQKKQARYIEKTRLLSIQMQETSLEIARLTGMALDPQLSLESSKSVGTLAIRKGNAGSSSSSSSNGHHLMSPVKLSLAAKRASSHDLTPSIAKTARFEDKSGSMTVPGRMAQARPIPTSPGPGFPESLKVTPAQPASYLSRRHAAHSISTPLAELDTSDIYVRRRQDIKPKAFVKKPRSLLFSRTGCSPDLQDLMITTSLEGDLQLWSTSKRKCIKNVGKGMFYPSWMEEICWATPTTLAMCPAGSISKDGNKEVVDDSVLFCYLNFDGEGDIDLRCQRFQQNPHNGPMMVVTAFQPGQSSLSETGRVNIVTGGSDKTVYLWDIKRDNATDDFELLDIVKLDIGHTNRVYSLCYDSVNEVLYTGGADDRFFTYDILCQRVTNELKFNSRVNHIFQSPVDNNLIMASLSSKDLQFALYDRRCNSLDNLQLQFGYQEHENISRYLRPDWHKNGYMVVCGSQSEPKVRFWDIRYSGITRGPSFSFPTGKESSSRILRSQFVPGSETLVTLSSTRTLTWTDYSTQHGFIHH